MSFQSGDAIQKRNYNLILGDAGAPAPPPPCTDGPVWANVALGGNFRFNQFSVAASPTSILTLGFVPGSDVARGFYSLDNGATFNLSTFPAGAFAPRWAEYGNGVFLSQQNGSAKLFRSTDDGATFSDVLQPFGEFTRAGYAEGVWFGTVAGGASIARSTDNALNWSNVALAGGIAQSNVAGNEAGLWIVAGNNGINGVVWTSINGGASWTANPAPWSDSTCPRSIEYSPTLGMFAAVNLVTTSQTVWTSLNGTNWAPQTLPAAGGNAWVDISWGDGVFIVVNQSNPGVAVSEDGVTWNLSPNSMPIDAAGIANNGAGIWIAQRFATFPISTPNVIVGIC